MIELIEGLPDGVDGIEDVGNVTLGEPPESSALDDVITIRKAEGHGK